ncbi:MAG: hypothetical protein AAFV01_13285, partial [Bacteroidota bacterium]
PLDRLLDSEIGRVAVPQGAHLDAPAGGGNKERRGWYELVASAEDGSGDKSRASDKTTGIPKKHTSHDDHEQQQPLVDSATSPEEDRAALRPASRGERGPAARPALNLRLQLVTAEADRRETSRAVEAMARPLAEDDESAWHQRFGAQNPYSTVVSFHENATYAQNCLGYVLDFLESCKNALSWTHPEKTAVLLACTLVGLVLFARMPTRWLLLAGGLYEFTYRLVPFYSGSPMTTRCLNLLRSLPNDADLKRNYHHRALRYARTVVRNERRRRRRAKLQALWDPRWQGLVNLRDDARSGPAGAALENHAAPEHHPSSLRRRHQVGGGGDAHDAPSRPPVDYSSARDAPSSSRDESWGQPRYLVLHGRRLLWWQSARDLDVGRAPGGQLLLQGHTGITDPSPTDLAACTTPKLLLAIFGQTTDGAPLRWTVMLHSRHHKAKLDAAVKAAVRFRLKS